MKIRLFMIVSTMMLVVASQIIARGDKVIPQIADGKDYRTKIILTNISSRGGTMPDNPSPLDYPQPIKNYYLKFFRQDGSPWLLDTSLGTGSKFNVALSPRQTLEISTSGKSNPTTSGYAILEDSEPATSYYAFDFTLGITVYYEVSLAGGGISDVISVPVNSSTALGTFPVKISQSQEIFTGIAVVNSGTSIQNKIKMNLFSQDGSYSKSAAFNLAVGQQKSEFLNQNLFPGLNDFTGSLEFYATEPIVILVLQQTAVSNGGVQYAVLTPTDREAVRQNSYVFLFEAVFKYPTSDPKNNSFFPLDADRFQTDFYRVTRGDEPMPHDLYYIGVDEVTRRLVSANGATLEKIGVKDDEAFDSLSIVDLKKLAYGTTSIDMSDGSAGFQYNFTFAVRTDLCNYAKMRLVEIVERTADVQVDSKTTKTIIFKDLVFELVVFR